MNHTELNDLSSTIQSLIYLNSIRDCRIAFWVLVTSDLIGRWKPTWSSDILEYKCYHWILQQCCHFFFVMVGRFESQWSIIQSPLLYKYAVCDSDKELRITDSDFFLLNILFILSTIENILLNNIYLISYIFILDLKWFNP